MTQGLIRKLEAITQVQHATEDAMQEVVEYIRTSPSPTSERAHEIIDEVLLAHDCESPEGHIVAGGTQSAEPHEKGSGILPVSMPIVIDIYPRSKSTGYFADMTRTICIGEPSGELQKMHDAVLEAQKLAISMIKPGVLGSEIQKAAEKYFETAGYKTSGKGKEFHFAEGFVHGIGHGVSTHIHDKPHLGRTGKDVLKEGDVITIEPGLYYKDIGGIRIEDLLVVTADGYDNLSDFPKTFTQNQIL